MSPRRRRPDPPLPVREGLGPVRIRLHGGRIADEMVARFGVDVTSPEFVHPFVDAAGEPVDIGSAPPEGTVVYTYREAPHEVPVPFRIDVLHRDQNVVVVDKPHFLATMPRGQHIIETALVRLRKDLDLPDLAPAHRLDRLTAGVLVFTVRREIRAAYHDMFARRRVAKTYEALAPVDDAIRFPRVLRSRIVKRRSVLQALEEPGEVNAETRIELLGSRGGVGRYLLEPHTGQTHQLRVHMNSLGLPIVNDPLYPDVVDVAPDDFGRPLKLLAKSIEFCDPLSGNEVRYESRRQL